jgi:antitoxin VapB
MMNLNIKNEEVYTLAARLSKLTGENMTRTILVSLRERLGRVQAPGALASELLAIGKDCASRLKEPYASIAHGDLLYDEKGLPK